MREVCLNEIKMKVFLEQEGLDRDMFDNGQLQVRGLVEDCLFLQTSIEKETFDSIKRANIFFLVGGSWRNYRIEKFFPYVNSSGHIAGIKFELPEVEQEEFYRDFTFARS